jgi:threonine dehydratase
MMEIPTLADIQASRERIEPFVVETPVWRWRSREIAEAAGAETEVFLKLELFQYTGTFNPRGALNVMLNLSPEALARGVTAVSAGNHAIAVSYSAWRLGTTAKVVMIKQADPARIAACQAYGAETVLVDTIHEAFEQVYQIEKEEGRTFVHPFEGPYTIMGTATVGLELCRQVAGLEAVIIPVGGGGLCAGIATAVKLIQPACQVFGVEPEGANSMSLSFASGKPESIDQVRTIADSLGAPYAAPYSFGLCQKHVDQLVLISDDQMRQAMRLLFQGMKLAVEPAGAAATAALCGPLREQLQGKRVGIIVCGTNISFQRFCSHLQEGLDQKI